MTPKQIERVQKKIKDIRAEIYREYKLWRGYHDGRGLRYAPPELYMKINDYKGGLTYYRWFMKNFPDDSCNPITFFEWSIVLFKNKKYKDAEKMASKAFFSNTYLFDKFFERKIPIIRKNEFSHFERRSFLEHFTYSQNQEEYADYARWLAGFEQSEEFIEIKDRFIQFNIDLYDPKSDKIRTKLLNSMRKYEKEVLGRY